MIVFETIPTILNSWVLLSLAAATAIIWGRLFAKRRPVAVVGCISQWDALVILIAVGIIAVFDILVMVSDSYTVNVAMSRIYRAWLFGALIYVGWRQS